MVFKKKAIAICFAATMFISPMQAKGVTTFDAANLAEWLTGTIRDNAALVNDKLEFAFNLNLKLNEMKQNIENMLYEQIPWGVGPKAKKIVEACMKNLQIPSFNMLVNAALPLECVSGQVLEIAGQELLGTTKMSLVALAGEHLKKAKPTDGVPTATLGATDEAAANMSENMSPKRPITSTGVENRGLDPSIVASQGLSTDNVLRKAQDDLSKAANDMAEKNARSARDSSRTAAFTNPNIRYLTDKQKDKVINVLNMKQGDDKMKAINKFEEEEKIPFLEAALALNTEVVKRQTTDELARMHDADNRKLYIVPTMNMEKNPNKDKGAIPLTGLEICLSNDISYHQCKKAFEKNAEKLNDAAKAVNDNLSKAKSKGSVGDQDFSLIRNLSDTNGVTTISSAILAYYQSTLAMGAFAASATENEGEESSASGNLTDMEKLAAQIVQTKAILTQLLFVNQNLADLNENLSTILLNNGARSSQDMTQLIYNVTQVQRAVEMLGANRTTE